MPKIPPLPSCRKLTRELSELLSKDGRRKRIDDLIRARADIGAKDRFGVYAVGVALEDLSGRCLELAKGLKE